MALVYIYFGIQTPFYSTLSGTVAFALVQDTFFPCLEQEGKFSILAAGK